MIGEGSGEGYNCAREHQASTCSLVFPGTIIM